MDEQPQEEERYDYQRQLMLDEERQREEEDRAFFRKIRKAWDVWAKTGKMPETVNGSER